MMALQNIQISLALIILKIFSLHLFLFYAIHWNGHSFLQLPLLSVFALLNSVDFLFSSLCVCVCTCPWTSVYGYRRTSEKIEQFPYSAITSLALLPPIKNTTQKTRLKITYHLKWFFTSKFSKNFRCTYNNLHTISSLYVHRYLLQA